MIVISIVQIILLIVALIATVKSQWLIATMCLWLVTMLYGIKELNDEI